MSYTLYYSPGTASMCVHWMLLELGVPFEARLTDIESGAQHSAEYLQLNPAGRVPTLVVDARPCVESTALLMLLAELHPDAGFAPVPGSEHRAEWLELMIFFANTILPAMRDWFYADRDGDGQAPEAKRDLAAHRIESAWERIDKKLSDGRAYLIGNRFGTADLMGVMLMRWSRNMPRPATSWEHIQRYVTSIRSRPAFIKLNKIEGLTDWSN